MGSSNLTALALQMIFRTNKLDSIFITIIGNSMFPTYKDGDKVKVYPIKRKVKVGDIVLYTHLKDSLTLHRIYKIKYDELGHSIYLTKGDNNPDIDPYTITDSNLIGLVN